jgi:DNA-binding MarR family transcriptional regulator
LVVWVGASISTKSHCRTPLQEINNLGATVEENQNRVDSQSGLTSKAFEEAMMPVIRQTIMAITSALTQYIGMSPVRVLLYQKLKDVEEISQAEIQRKLGVGGAVVTRIIKQMEAEGLIVRRPDPSDNRYMLVRLTEAGRQRRDEVVLKTHMIQSTLLRGLSREEFQCMQSALSRIRQNAESLTGDPAKDNQFPGEDYF